KYHYEVNDPRIKTVYMPSNRVLVLTSFLGLPLEPILKADGKKPAVSADTVAAIRAIEKNTFWGVVPFEGKLRTDMEAGLAKDPPPTELKALVDGLLKAKNAIFWGKLDSNRLSIGLGLNCADPNSAGQVVTEMQAGWEKAKGEVAMVQLFLAP